MNQNVSEQNENCPGLYGSAYVHDYYQPPEAMTVPATYQACPNRYIYFKQSLVNHPQASQTNHVFGTKLLINPNFSRKVHINPNFNKHETSSVKNRLVHVNPNIFKQTKLQAEIIYPNIVNLMDKNKAAHLTACSVGAPKTNNSIKSKHGNVGVASLMVPKTNLIKNDLSVIQEKKPEKTAEWKNCGKKRKFSVNTKYKIVKRSTSFEDSISKEQTPKRLCQVKSKFKIDYTSQHMMPQNNTKNVNKVINFSNHKVIRVKQSPQSKLICINGVLYKRSPNTLKKTNSTNAGKTDSGTSSSGKYRGQRLLLINGQKYKINSSQRVLRKVLKSDGKTVVTPVKRVNEKVALKPKKLYKFVKADNTRKQFLLSQAKYRSINTLSNKRKKSNVPCPIYRRFGKCKGKDKGTCIRIHNPDQIALCPKFLLGECVNEKCLLSHKISAKKMPTCRFFLEGFCSRENCSYLHVKINAKEEICKDFIEGFCKKGAECNKRHQFLCPSFEKNGKCTQRKCPFPHQEKVSKSSYHKVVTSKLPTLKPDHDKNIIQKMCSKAKVPSGSDTVDSKISDSTSRASTSTNDNVVKVKQIKTVNQANNRYYSDYSNQEPIKLLNVPDTNIDSLINDSLDNQTFSETDTNVRAIKRPKVGDLPSFIPFFDDEES